MNVPCKQCPVLPRCVWKSKVSCKPLAIYMRKTESAYEIQDIFHCGMIGYSYIDNCYDVTFIRDQERINKVMKEGVTIDNEVSL